MGAQRELLSWKQTFRPRKTGQTVPLTFEVPEGIERLEIRCRLVPGFCRNPEANVHAVLRAAERYALQAEPVQHLSPDEVIRMRGLEKLLSAVANLLNVTVHDPSGRYIGRWDAPDKENAAAAFLSRSGSSPGFVATPIHAGTWRLVVEAWYIFHGPATASIEILAHQAGPGASTPLAPLARGNAEARQLESAARRGEGRAAGQAPARRARKVGFRPSRCRWPGVLLGEMHSHTTHSDGVYGVDEQAERASELGLDFIALTDHNTTSGHAEFSADAPVVQIPGEEMTTFFGHFCNYGVTRCHEWHDLDGKQRIRAAIAEATAEGALSSLAHPHAIDPPACVGCGFRKGTVPYREFRLLEVWSGAWKVRSPEIIATRALWDRLWARGTRLVPIAARDWHSERQEDTPAVRFPVTAVLADERTPAGILAALRAGRVFATSGPMVRLGAEGGGRSAGIGESLALPAWALALLEVHVELPEKTSGIVSIVHDGRQLAARSIGESSELSFRLETAKKGRYRVELWSSQGELLLLTNHLCVR